MIVALVPRFAALASASFRFDTNLYLTFGCLKHSVKQIWNDNMCMCCLPSWTRACTMCITLKVPVDDAMRFSFLDLSERLHLCRPRGLTEESPWLKKALVNGSVPWPPQRTLLQVFFFERLTLFQVLGIWQLNSQHWWSVASGALVCGALCHGAAGTW